VLIKDLDRVRDDLENILSTNITSELNEIGEINLKIDDLLRLVFGNPKDNDGISLSHTFTVTESFDQPNGKFGDNLGNAIVIDC
jgi:hypothetical protein